MDAVEFVREYRRMCGKNHCAGCPLCTARSDCMMDGDFVGDAYIGDAKVVFLVEQWAKDHPAKTRQSEFLKMFPNAPLYSGVVGVDPCKVDETFECKYCGEDCSSKCRRDYWSQEVTE